MEHKWKQEINAWLDGEKVQYADVDEENWRDLDDQNHHLSLFGIKDIKFRIAPKTININGHEVPKPCRKKLEDGAEYFYPCPSYNSGYSSFYWHDNPYNFYLLKIGFVHLTKEAAMKHAEALLSFTQSEEN